VTLALNRCFTVRTDKRKIDHSWSVGELEHLRRDGVIEYLQMPERVRNVECHLGALRGGVAKLTEVLSGLYGLFFCDLKRRECCLWGEGWGVYGLSCLVRCYGGLHRDFSCRRICSCHGSADKIERALGED
jgi:hypothetical protein